MPRFFRILRIILLVVALLAQPAGLAGAQDIAQNNLIPAQRLINPDGSLRLDAASSGSLDLKGWDVRLDPRRGPVFARLPQQSPFQIVLQFFGWFGRGSNGAGGGSLNNEVDAIAISGTNVYVGGLFTDVNNNGTILGAADHIARWDGSNWSALGYGADPNSGALNNNVWAIEVSGSNIYVGGDFTNINNKGAILGAADYIARWDGSNWSALGHGAGAATSALNNTVFAIAVSGSNIYAGGDFINVNNKGTVLGAADYIARWDGSNWSALGYGAGTGAAALNQDVVMIAASGGSIYVGGLFTNVNNKGTVLGAADYIARWDGSNWSALGYGANTNMGALNHSVGAIAVSGGNVYAGGNFTDVNNKGTILGAADYIARWDGSNWSALGNNGAGDGSINQPVLSIAVSGTNVYAGGWFTDVNNKGTVLGAADYIARWNSSNWSALGSNGAGDGSISGTPYVDAITLSGSNVYTGGGFSNVTSDSFAHPEAENLAVYENNTFSFASTGANDGWVLESAENTSVGGSLNSGAATFVLGDDAKNRQYRSILHFDTSFLPDTAVILSATLKIKKAALVGANPFATFQGLLVDIANLPYSGNSALQKADFQAVTGKSAIGTFGNIPAGAWYTAELVSSAFPLINRTGPTELRLHFKLDDNNNLAANYVRFFSGDTVATADRPVLTISYYVP